MDPAKKKTTLPTVPLLLHDICAAYLLSKLYGLSEDMSQYLKLGLGCYLPHLFQFISHCYPIT
jgi:hypothetical protein